MTVPQRRSLSFQAFWFLFARVLGFAFSFALPLILVRVLDQSGFGLYKQAFQFVITAQAILGFGFSFSAFYFLQRDPESAPAVAWNIFLYHVAAGAAGAGVLLLWPDVLRLISGSGELVRYSVPLAAVLFTFLTANFLEAIATARSDVFWSTIFIAGSQFSRTFVLIMAALFVRNVGGLLTAAVIHGMLQTAVLLWYILRHYPGCWRKFDRRVALEQISYVLPVGAAGMLYTLQSELHWMLVANRFSAAQFAIYAVGTTQVPLIGMLREAVASVLMPRISSLQKQGRKEEILEVVLIGVRKLAMAYLPAFFLLIVVGKDFILTLFRSTYLDSWPIFAVNLLMLPLGVLVLDPVTRAYREYRVLLLKIKIGVCVVQVITSVIFIHLFGMIGAVLALVVVNGTESTVISAMVLRMLGFGRRHVPFVAMLGRIALAAAIPALLVLLVQIPLAGSLPVVRLVTAGIVYGLGYICCTLALGNLSADEKELVNRYAGRFLKIRPFATAT